MLLKKLPQLLPFDRNFVHLRGNFSSGEQEHMGGWSRPFSSWAGPGSLTCEHNCSKALLWPHGLYSPWDSPRQNTGVGSCSLLQGIFPTQGSNPGLPHCGQILYQLSHKRSPKILEWVAYPFSRGSSQTRDWTGVSCIADEFFTNWAIREARKHTGQKIHRGKTACIF